MEGKLICIGDTMKKGKDIIDPSIEWRWSDHVEWNWWTHTWTVGSRSYGALCAYCFLAERPETKHWVKICIHISSLPIYFLKAWTSLKLSLKYIELGSIGSSLHFCQFYHMKGNLANFLHVQFTHIGFSWWHWQGE